MERRCVGHDIVSHRLLALKHHSEDPRFDVEDEEDTNDNLKLYGFLMQSAIDPCEGQTQNSDFID